MNNHPDSTENPDPEDPAAKQRQADSPATGEFPPPAWPPGRWLGLVVLFLLLSTLLAYAGAYFADDYLDRGQAYPKDLQKTHPFYRFDSQYYEDIAANGYHYNGDPYSSPNIVFAPLYPLEIRLLAKLSPFSYRQAGFWVARLDLLAGLLLIFIFMWEQFNPRTAVFVVFGLCFSAGSFAFHSYYSESTMLAWLGLTLVLMQRRWEWPLAMAAFALGASRTTAGPFVLVICLWFLWRAWQDRRSRGLIMKRFACAALSMGGILCYLGYLWMHFGNPFTLLPEIQQSSWEHFHQPVKLWELLTFKHLFVYWADAFSRGSLFLTDIMTTNLIYTTLAVISAFYALFRFRQPVLRFGFAGYVLLIYYANAGSVYLNSTHRYFALMLPIFILVSDLHAWLRGRFNAVVAWSVSGLLGLISMVYFVIYTAYFSMGHWYYF